MGKRIGNSFAYSLLYVVLKLYKNIPLVKIISKFRATKKADDRFNVVCLLLCDLTALKKKLISKAQDVPKRREGL